jgi:hypothetical protein
MTDRLILGTVAMLGMFLQLYLDDQISLICLAITSFHQTRDKNEQKAFKK